MEYLKTPEAYVVRLKRGEEILESLTDLCLKESITLASVNGIGACDLAEVGVYEVDRKEYLKTTLTGSMEILSLQGNITRKDGKPYLHLHAVLCGEDCRCMGGHLNKARISVTCELVIRPLSGTVGRIPDEETGINLMAFGR